MWELPDAISSCGNHTTLGFVQRLDDLVDTPQESWHVLQLCKPTHEPQIDRDIAENAALLSGVPNATQGVQSLDVPLEADNNISNLIPCVIVIYVKLVQAGADDFHAHRNDEGHIIQVGLTEKQRLTELTERHLHNRGCHAVRQGV